MVNKRECERAVFYSLNARTGRRTTAHGLGLSSGGRAREKEHERKSKHALPVFRRGGARVYIARVVATYRLCYLVYEREGNLNRELERVRREE